LITLNKWIINLRISFLLLLGCSELLFWRQLRELCEDVSDTDRLLYFPLACKWLGDLTYSSLLLLLQLLEASC
jgi:hypothetical protein